MRVEDVEFEALVAGPRDTLVIVVPDTIDDEELDGFHTHVRARLGHDRLVVLRGVGLAVLRETAGPCMAVSESPFPGGAPSWCELPAGHIGGHVDGSTSWIERSPGEDEEGVG